jgi:hypothetical protein
MSLRLAALTFLAVLFIASASFGVEATQSGNDDNRDLKLTEVQLLTRVHNGHSCDPILFFIGSLIVMHLLAALIKATS